MADTTSFLEQQRAFSAYLRNPESVPKPAGIDDGRLAVYRNAVFANVEQFLSDNFPRVKQLFDPDAWQELVRDYIVRHVSKTTVFVELPLEFLEYLEHLRDDESDPPFLYELAHFEWLETLVSSDESPVSVAPLDPAIDWLVNIPLINPVVRLVKYAFPVHQAIERDQTEQATYVAAFRNRDHQYAYLALNAPSARMVELLAAGERLSGRELLQRIAAEMGVSADTELIQGGIAILTRLAENQIIVGAERA